jgi:O-antigen ligase
MLAVSAPVHGFLLGLCMVLGVATPLCLFLGVRGFAPVVGIAGLLCIPWARPHVKDWTGVLVLVVLAVWAVVSVAWSPAPNLHLPHSAKALSRLTFLHLAIQLICCTALITALRRLDRAGAAKALGWIAWGLFPALLLLTEEGFSHAALYPKLLALFHQPGKPFWEVVELSVGGYVVAILAWPLGVAMYSQGHPRLALIPAAFVPLSMVLMRGAAPTVALAVSLPIFLLALRRGPAAIKIMGAVTAVYMLATPLVMLALDRLGVFARLRGVLPPSWSDRLRIWAFVAEHIRAAPLRGAGLDASRTFPGVVLLHPHNAPLQLYYELGLPGALLGALFWLWLWRRIADVAQRDRLVGAAAAATAAAYLTISAVSFGLWQEWWLCVGAFALTLCLLLATARRGSIRETDPTSTANPG